MAKRGSAIDLPESWLEQCREWRKSKNLLMGEVGAQLARAVRRGRPFGASTIQRYLSGQVVTGELTDAFAKAMGVVSPIQIVESERLRAWYGLGERLESSDPETFEWELGRLRHLVALTEKVQESSED